MLLAAGLATFIGLSLGLLGGGGSILTVPLLVYGLGVDEKAAIATSLIVVAVTSGVAAVGHARHGNIRWRVGLLFAAGGMVGAYLGGMLGGFLSGTVLLVLFGLMMLATGIAMWRPRRALDPTAKPASTPKVLAEGLVVGLVTGLVGAGGGFLVVPALVLLGGLDMRRAVGTSLLVISLKSLAGFAGYVGHVQIDVTLAAVVTAGAVVGALVGARFSTLIPPDKLRRGFSVFVLVMAAFVLLQELT